jgi:hypothetical protein
MFGSDDSLWLHSIGSVFSALGAIKNCFGFNPFGSFRFISFGIVLIKQRPNPTF